MKIGCDSNVSDEICQTCRFMDLNISREFSLIIYIAVLYGR